MLETEDAYTSLLVNAPENTIYIFGSIVAKGAKHRDDVGGFCIYKFDLNSGDLLWKMQQDFESNVTQGKVFGNYTLSLFLDMTAGNKLRLTAKAGNVFVTYDMDASGKVLDRYPNTGILPLLQQLPFCIPASADNKADHFIADLISKEPGILKYDADLTLRSFPFSKSGSDIIMLEDKKKVTCH